MARLDGLTVYPVKGFDGVRVESSDLVEGGTLKGDREFALFDEEGEVFNGKRSDRVHRLSTTVDPATGDLTVETSDGDIERFRLHDPADRERASDWFSEVFGERLTLRQDGELGYVDRRDRGPSVVSTATLATVASWFDDLTVDGVRRRLRANVEIADVPAFWEDRFVGDGTAAFEIGGVRFEDATPCGRCVVPERDPDTGEPLPEFRQTFVRRREETLPDWADEDAFDHFYAVMIIARVPRAFRDRTLTVGDPVEVVDGHAEE